jgi:hypothetical protein
VTNPSKYSFQLFIQLTFLISLLLTGCEPEEGPSVPNSNGNPLKGAYILYENSGGQTDYAFYDASSNTVTDNVFSSFNQGRKLGVTAGDMKINNNRDIYISTLGTQGSMGTLYKIAPENNSMTDSIHFGRNPYGFAINNNRLVISNLGSSFASVFDLDLNLINDSIEVGPQPVGVLYGFGKYVITRSGASPENSLALIDESSNLVQKLYYPSNPVSALYNVSGIFVSSFTSKKIFRIDSNNFETVDSFSVPTSQSSIGQIVFKTQRKFFIVAGLNEIWEAEAVNNTLQFRLLFPSGQAAYILNIAYESTKNEIFIAEGNNLFSNGAMYIIDAETGLINNTHQLSGRRPVRFAFKY